MAMKRGNIEGGRAETDREFARRVRHEIDQDSWHGTDRIGARFPEKAIIHDIPADETVHIYRQPKGE